MVANRASLDTDIPWKPFSCGFFLRMRPFAISESPTRFRHDLSHPQLPTTPATSAEATATETPEPARRKTSSLPTVVETTERIGAHSIARARITESAIGPRIAETSCGPEVVIEWPGCSPGPVVYVA